MTWMIWSRKSWRFSNSLTNSICLPTVLSASENLALNSSLTAVLSEARSTPMALATLSTSSAVSLTRR